MLYPPGNPSPAANVAGNTTPSLPFNGHQVFPNDQGRGTIVAQVAVDLHQIAHGSASSRDCR